MRSKVYSSENRAAIEHRTLSLLNSAETLVAASPRGVGDAVQELLSEQFNEVLAELSHDYSSTFARRAMADLAFTDVEGCYHVVDVKTHRSDTKFNMPNLISVERLARFYEEDTNFFSLLYVRYGVSGKRIIIDHVNFVPIEWLSWDCLTIGALGWGQLQLANANRIDIVQDSSRRDWMIQPCNEILEFYPREIQKIAKRTQYFERVRRSWEAKEGSA
ncbi:hypothetical protein BE11_46130 [Sorangium cellulosum]|nr:hypothetical protein BE11_46130 [Sorangium cellulosum]